MHAISHVRPLDRRALLLVVLLCLCWGLYQVSVKIAGAGVPPLMQAGLRSLGSALLVLAWCRLRNVPLFDRDGTLGAGLLTGILFALEFAFIYLGIARTDVARGVLLIYLSPFVVAIGAHFLVPGDRLSAVKLVGLVAAFGGLALILDEPVTRQILAALALIGGGIYLVNRSQMTGIRYQKNGPRSSDT